ncbi:Intradiol ring-cleavage dioxygenase [Crepidotus variabilis]|uniref:Intradiol ring-cleavage dioxygenase n=1 Tax=Crepidotus variabilis TaxID=179855 RepID=A0A9P6E5P1_9AGAR|nr:Intradiol ring-cleavage dioxygenase [Crepidotus variabilis]
MKFSIFFSLLNIAFVVLAHPEPEPELSATEVVKRELEARNREWKTRNCQAEIRAFTANRMAKRETKLEGRQAPSGTEFTAAAHVTGIPDSATCIVAPEVTEGPYYINNELVRQNLTETQGGTVIVLDIGVININTCQPISDAFVELWAGITTNYSFCYLIIHGLLANATGIYGGYSGATNAVKKETFGRGGYPTDSAGIVEMTTIYPGYYFGRTAHIHTMIHLNYTKNTDGTIKSSSGSMVHSGQFFFDETWNDKVYANSPYTLNKQPRTRNAQDGFIKEAQGNGYNSFASLGYLSGSSLSTGLLGYITVGVDPKADYAIGNQNFYGGTGL